MDKSAVMKPATAFAYLIADEFKPKSVILYGSYANGTAHDDSDIDIAVVLEKCDDTFLEKFSRLFEVSHSIDDRIEPILLEEQRDESGFLQQVKDTGHVLYSQK
jgi:uncharacterized protein